MRAAINTLLVLTTCFVFIACKQDHVNGSEKTEKYELIPDTTLKYAKLFSISLGNDFKVIHFYGEKGKTDTTANFIVYKGNKPQLNLPNSFYVKVPCSRIISLSSIYSNMLTELKGIDHIIAIENKDYYSNEAILKKINEGKIVEVQRSTELDKEKVLSLKPDVIFAFGMGRSQGDFDSKILQSGIPVVVSIDHLEKTPLARAEWIKFFAQFIDRSVEADSLFDNVEKNYNELISFAHTYTIQPTVFTELKYGDTWYVPGGKSFMAQLINDANGSYLWNDDTLSGSLPLSFEAVYKKANAAEFWLNVSMCHKLSEMLQQDKRYADFKAFKEKKVYNNNLHCNTLNYSTYWETGLIYPDRILSDLIKLFHPASVDSLGANMYYYKAVN